MDDDHTPESTIADRMRKRLEQRKDPSRSHPEQVDPRDEVDNAIEHDEASESDREGLIENALIRNDLDSDADDFDRSEQDGWAYDDNDE